MTKKLLAWSILAVLLVAPIALAQDPPLMVNVLTIHTKLGHQERYETLLPEMWGAFRRAGLDTGIQVSSSVSEPGVYSFAAPFSSMAELGTITAKVFQGWASIPNVMQQIFGTYTHVDQTIWAIRGDLSYTSSSPRVATDDIGYTRVSIFYPHPEKAIAFEALMREVAALYKKHSNPNTSAWYALLIGAEAPAYALLENAKDQADFFVEEARIQEMMASELQEIARRGGPMLRKIDYGASVPRPDLSYVP